LAFTSLWQTIGWLMVIMVVVLTLMPKPPTPPVLVWDKSQHLVSYGLLMFWFDQAFRGRVRWISFLVGLGIVLEYLQGWFGYRQFDYGDMLANGLGVLAGLLIASTPLGLLVNWLDSTLARYWPNR
jgi:VanZ family protein